jgi:geranyl-CoA carboxylase alpha subunit
MAFTKILIANRGEIAVRIAGTARDLGYRTVAVFSDADAGALHVASADEAVRLGPAPARESYLCIDAVIAAARRSGADAVHPGYGFLSENPEFAEAVEKAGLVFIGPLASAIRAMGDKAAAKRLMIAAGVPCVPGYQGVDQSDATFREEARRIGFPVMIKAAAGGGGRGMRCVDDPTKLPAALAAARSESANAFGSGELILEKAMVNARHVEIQIFADAHGAAIHLGERDCSAQRRHQKVIEEAPSPAVSAALRQAMGQAAVAAARAVSYRGAGTVEFMLAADGRFYFLEMNTRLQVEHPVTEMITGLDLVALQLAIAAGDPLPLSQDDVRLDGHAIEVRLYAEDPYRDFLPQSGVVLDWRVASGAGIRVDHGLKSGQEVTSHYDPMLAKIIAHGATREEARRRLLAALDGTLALGLETNRMFLRSLLSHPVFVKGEATTDFIAAEFSRGSLVRPAPDADMQALAAVLLFEAGAPAAAGVGAWRSTGPAPAPMRIEASGSTRAAGVQIDGRDRYTVRLDSVAVGLEIVERTPGGVRFVVDGLQRRARFALADGALYLEVSGVAGTFRDRLFERADVNESDGEARMVAPMNGRVVGVLVKKGQSVVKGQRIVVLEAMKMQHEIVAARAGVIAELPVKEGDQVATRQLLAALAGETPQ